jgi:tryptophan 2,3-dioxygenase
MSQSKNYPPISYSEYLKTPELLNLQSPRSTEYGKDAHDEMLFIVVHQTYELWFRQILHELNSILKVFNESTVKEEEMITVVSRLSRIVEIQRLLVDQVSVLETMTPLDFLDFRDLLYPASGFQSVQWRLIENKLGLKTKNRLKYNAQPYHAHVNQQEQKLLLESESMPSLFDQVDAWLARMPFLGQGDFNFASEYGAAVKDMLDQDESQVRRFAKGEEDLQKNLKSIEDSRTVFESLLTEEKYKLLVDAGTFRLQHRSIQAALFILLYRDQPIFGLPFQLLTRLQDIDELMTTWRYRHSLMAHRMLGTKIGTGGSSGHQYLRAATEQHRVFGDFFNLATFLIPRSRLPKLPESVTRRLGFQTK